MKTAVIFDMDGLMFDTERLLCRLGRQVAQEMGFVLTDPFLESLLGRNQAATRQRFGEEFCGAVDYDSFRDRRRVLLNRLLETEGLPVKPGLHRLLEWLECRGHPMTVATSTGRERAREYLDRAEVSRYFPQFVAGDMVTHSKPDPEIFLRASALLATPPQSCLVLEDSPNGILAAHRAGMRPVMIPDLVQPDPVIQGLLYARLENLGQVIPLLEGLEGEAPAAPTISQR